MNHIRRVFMATINYDHPQRGMEQAFKQVFGEENVDTFDYLDLQRQPSMPVLDVRGNFVAEAVKFRPDWIWFQLQDTNVLQADDILEIRRQLPRCLVTHWTGDCRPAVSSYLSSICKATHMTLISSEGQVAMFRAAGAESVAYVQIGLDWDEDVLGIPDWTPPFRVPDVVFIGGYYGKSFEKGSAERRAAVDALVAAGVDVGIVGRGWPAGYPVVGECTVKQQHHVWKRAKVAINVNHFNDVQLYYSDRQLIAMASGTPLVCKYVPELGEEFADGEQCSFFQTNEELVVRVKRLLGNEELRERVGQAGRLEVMRNHSWHRRILDLLPTAEKAWRRLAT